MKPLLVWCGPIDSSELERITWWCAPSILVVPMGIGAQYDCSGPMTGWSIEQHVDCHGSSAFGRLAASWHNSPEAMLASRGMSWADSRPRALASFSAGHGLVEPMALAGWNWIHLADSYYTGSPAVKPGLGAYAKLAAEGKCVLTATTSDFASKGTQSATACIRALVEYAGLVERPDLVRNWPWTPKPLRAWQRGGALVADFGTTISHGEHATLVAPRVFDDWIAPYLCLNKVPGWFAGTTEPGSTARTIGVVVSIAAGLALGLLGWKLWPRRGQPRQRLGRGHLVLDDHRVEVGADGGVPDDDLTHRGRA